MSEDFHFVLGREGARTVLRLQARGMRQLPDFRRHTGLKRELLREFIALKREFAVSRIIDFDAGEDEYTLLNPGEKIIAQALDAGLLRSPGGVTYSRAEGDFHCALLIKDITEKEAEVSIVLRDEDGTIIAGGQKPALRKDGDAGENAPYFYAVSPGIAVYGDKIYPVGDLGLRWAETGRIYARLTKTELPAFISLVVSGFSNPELIYEGWLVKPVRPALALPGLLFMEIDKYGYLHIRPISFLRGFPPLFLENEEIVSVAEMDETGKTIGIAEVIFPEAPEDGFREMLARHGGQGRGRKGKNSARSEAFYEENGRFIIEPEFARAFIGENIIALSERFVLLETEVLSGYRLKFSKPKIKLSVSRRTSMGSGIDYFAGNAEVEIEGEAYSFARFMAEYRKSSCITLADGSRSFPDKRTMDRLERLVSRIKGEDEVELSYFDIPLLLQDDLFQIEGQIWEEARPFFANYNTIAERRGSWTLSGGELRHYQEYGVRWLDYLGEYRMGACLADEMGLGKTIQVIALLRSLKEKGESGLCLILCPKSLVYNWAAELDRFAPELPYLVHYGLDRDAAEIAGGGTEFRIILSTYATLRRDVGDFKHIEFSYIILDESQNIKNLSSQTTTAVLSLNTGRRLALSGTPVENNLGELYSLFRFLNPGFFGSEKNFSQRYQRPIQENSDEDALKDLKLRIYPFILRRLKRDVLKELPDKTEETAYIELEETHLAIYHRRRQEYKELIDGIIAKGEMAKSSIIIFKALTELRRLASVPEAEGEYGGPSAKRLYLTDRIAEIAENGHKCLVFTNFLAGVDLVSRDLADLGIPNLTMTGATVDRQSLVRRFQTDSGVKAFIMTLKTGGTGLNLTAADYIFILDPWWNSAAETQAIDRSHRIGQVNPVFCFRLIARDTIEERIVELQKRKTDLAGALLSDDAGSLKSLSPEDAAYLVGGR
ncbi:MAG: DEAD/DEAH box helicase [Spirochaetaceae bacterium]|jgi:superfamily II DNA or RNA helicase|nr:DEAD/DEAH box helicase [Spirochaetaceae bacterium]